MFKLIPSNNKFYDHFERGAEILVTASSRFAAFLNKFEHVERHAEEIKSLEHEADENTHEAMELLHQSFITPLERGDIRRLIETQDDVIDLLDDAARSIELYEITEVLPEVKDLIQVLVDAAKSVQAAIRQLRVIKKKNDIMQLCIDIRRLENEGDRINHELLARLFKSGMNPLDVLKWKEIVDDIESAIDGCQDVANVLEGIVLENG